MGSEITLYADEKISDRKQLLKDGSVVFHLKAPDSLRKLGWKFMGQLASATSVTPGGTAFSFASSFDSSICRTSLEMSVHSS